MTASKMWQNSWIIGEMNKKYDKFKQNDNNNLPFRAGGTGGAIAPPIFASSSTLAPPIIAGSCTSWGCYSYPNFFDLPAGLLMNFRAASRKSETGLDPVTNSV